MKDTNLLSLPMYGCHIMSLLNQILFLFHVINLLFIQDQGKLFSWVLCLRFHNHQYRKRSVAQACRRKARPTGHVHTPSNTPLWPWDMIGYRTSSIHFHSCRPFFFLFFLNSCSIPNGVEYTATLKQVFSDLIMSFYGRSLLPVE